MKLKYLALIPFLMLCSCQEKKESQTRPLGDDGYYALFMYNYPRMTTDSVNGNDIKTESLLYKKMEIVPGELIAQPEDPTRNNYEFTGWFKESTCDNMWDFAVDKPLDSVFLYAKWTIKTDDDFVEPEYVYPETIITDAEFRVTGILNTPVSTNSVDLTAGAINRLIKNKTDVRFAVNYERREDVTMSSAVYDVDTSKITITTSTNAVFEYTVNDITASLSIANVNASYETKAQNYEKKDEDATNYHVMLAGSSSMEFWETYEEDMSPIISYNHGIGGTTVQQWTEKLSQRLVLPYAPKAVVYYVGVNNIINSSDDGDKTGRALVELFDTTHQTLPNTKIFYVLINKLPGFLNNQPDFDVANNYALEYEKAHDYLTCIDAGKGLLKDNGKPSAAYFRTDGLHMSRYGYVIWGNAIKKAVVDWMR